MTEQNLETYLELAKIGYGADPDNAHGDYSLEGEPILQQQFFYFLYSLPRVEFLIILIKFGA